MIVSRLNSGCFPVEIAGRSLALAICRRMRRRGTALFIAAVQSPDAMLVHPAHETLALSR